ncbi:unnamed protein product [Blepharisma stoltei]|uniref:Ankyrin repeat domain-containing protein n=1 Tax=Blepharisma stoltei TaxID=1481888 RepID=A0AAU9JRI9_9CILI|nr:unnamed protein product [Blepharisma stoltei]
MVSSDENEKIEESKEAHPSISSTPNSKRSKWALLRNVLKAITLLKVHDADPAVEVNEILVKIQQIPTDKAYRMKEKSRKDSSPYSIALSDLRREQTLFRCAEQGRGEDLQRLVWEIDNNPYRYLVPATHPQSFLNKRNGEGKTALYVACKNGNLEVVKILIEKGAVHQITSVIEKEEETCLEVAVRWGHKKIVEFLLESCKWSSSELQKSLKVCRHKDLEILLKKNLKTKNKGCQCYIW